MAPSPRRAERLFFAGDVMTGRGIDQVLPFPGDPTLHEAWVRDARDYVRLAERHSGAIRRPLGFGELWGDLAGELDRLAPAVRIVNLETSITRRGEPWPDKEVRYRMTPENVGCLVAGRVDVCTLANNHVLDYGPEGLDDTLATLAAAKIAAPGAGRDREEAQRPAIVALEGGARVVVLAIGSESSGIPPAWGAREDRPGVDLLADLSERSIAALCARIEALDRPGDILVVSIHWGSNWGYHVPPSHALLAHRVIDAGADVVHGHSSHHPRPIEIYRGRPIFYGCGDLVNDYEGIEDPAHDSFRAELALAYSPEIEPTTGELVALTMSPMRIRKLRLERAAPEDADWLARTLDRVSEPFGAHVALTPEMRLEVRWRAKQERSPA